MARRSIGTPLTIGIVVGVLLLSLAVGWQILVWSDPPPLARGFTTLDWILLVLGSLFFVLVLIGTVLLCAWLVREMRLNQAQRAFLDAVTHELKTPLASFRLYLDTLGRHDLPPEKRSEFLGRMRGDLDRLEDTVHQVLAAAKAEERQRRVRRGAVALSEILATCIDQVRERNRLPAASFHLWAEEETRVRGDSNEIGLIFSNLLQNAVKYSDDPVDVRVGVSETQDGRVRVEITDRGVGIPKGELGKVFQRFYQAGRDVQRKAAGVGLGLFIVRNLVRRQGGRVVALSDGDGRGSRFVVTLRAAPPV